MNKFISLMFGLILAVGTNASATTISGTIKNASGTAQPSGTVQFTLIGCATNQMSLTGGGSVTTSYTFTANGSGVVSGTVLGNDLIVCPANGQTQYMVATFTAAGQLISAAPYTLVDASGFNINTATTTVATKGSLVTNPLTSQWDLFIGGINGIPSRLPLGSNGTFLEATTGGLAWGSPSDFGSGITQLTGAVTTPGSSSGITTITPTGVTAGCPNIGGLIVCIAASGQITSYGSPFGMSVYCSASGNFELGYTSTSPNTCTLSYANGTAASASVTDGTHSYTQTTPYTTYTGAYTYLSNTTFSASSTATNSQTASAAAGIAFYYCTFAGVGGSGGTGATASGTGNCSSGETATVSGATSTTILNSNNLGNTYAGQTFTLNPSGQYLVLLLSGGCGHTLTVNTFTTAFTTLALTPYYTNLLGGHQTGMCLYTGQTTLTGSYSVVVSAL